MNVPETTTPKELMNSMKAFRTSSPGTIQHTVRPKCTGQTAAKSWGLTIVGLSPSVEECDEVGHVAVLPCSAILVNSEHHWVWTQILEQSGGALRLRFALPGLPALADDVGRTFSPSCTHGVLNTPCSAASDMNGWGKGVVALGQQEVPLHACPGLPNSEVRVIEGE
eukprot:2006893-Rhodomonas_salina.1